MLCIEQKLLLAHPETKLVFFRLFGELLYKGRTFFQLNSVWDCCECVVNSSVGHLWGNLSLVLLSSVTSQ